MRRILSVLWVIAAVLTGGWGRAADPVSLPEPGDVCSICLVSAAGAERETADREEIAALLQTLREASPTRMASVNDAPGNGTAYGTITIRTDDGETVLYFYDRDGTHYLEQPYQGIYTLPEGFGAGMGIEGTGGSR